MDTPRLYNTKPLKFESVFRLRGGQFDPAAGLHRNDAGIKDTLYISPGTGATFLPVFQGNTTH